VTVRPVYAVCIDCSTVLETEDGEHAECRHCGEKYTLVGRRWHRSARRYEL
jgi:DNA-directed RNA polymerase subunit RPC12/RpoP